MRPELRLDMNPLFNCRNAHVVPVSALYVNYLHKKMHSMLLIALWLSCFSLGVQR